MSGNERTASAHREIDRAVRAATVTVRTLGPGDDPVRLLESLHDPYPEPDIDPPDELDDPDPSADGGLPPRPAPKQVPSQVPPQVPRPRAAPSQEPRTRSVLADSLGFNLTPPDRAKSPSPPRRPNRLNLLIERINDRLPVTLQGRWRLDRRTGTALAAVVAVAAVVLGGWTLFRAQSRQVAEPQLVTVGPAAHARASQPSAKLADPEDTSNLGPEAASGAGVAVGLQGAAPPGFDPGAATATGIVVDVEGKVAKPGVIHLPAGSRVMDALHAAGGALPGTDLVPLNQARVLNDGEQVLVGAPAGVPQLGAGSAVGPASAAHSSGGKALPPGPVHLNTATADQLEQLPGVGPAMAQRILDWRAQHGTFRSVTDLEQVKGVGPAKFAALRQWVTL